MQFKTGQGLWRYVPPHAVVCISNYREANSEQPLNGMSVIKLINGDMIVAEGKAGDLYKALYDEMIHLR